MEKGFRQGAKVATIPHLETTVTSTLKKLSSFMTLLIPIHSFNIKWIEIPSVSSRTVSKLDECKKSCSTFDEENLFVTT